jgi:hypothetical protein
MRCASVRFGSIAGVVYDDDPERKVGSQMTSAWWLLVAFIGGGSAGMLLAAMMRMAGDLSEQSDSGPRAWIGNDPIRLPGRKQKFCSFRCRDSFVDANRLS